MIEQIIYLLENYGKTFLKGLGATLLLAICGTLFGLLIGILIAVIRNNKVLPTDSTIKKILKRIGLGITYVYITVLRGTPMMVQALIIYFGGKMIGIPWNSTELGKMFIDGHLVCGLFVITLNTAAYMAENVRAGINAIDPGQMEASRALGMTYFETMVHVIIPQALKYAIPNIGNEFIGYSTSSGSNYNTWTGPTTKGYKLAGAYNTTSSKPSSSSNNNNNKTQWTFTSV